MIFSWVLCVSVMLSQIPKGSFKLYEIWRGCSKCWKVLFLFKKVLKGLQNYVKVFNVWFMWHAHVLISPLGHLSHASDRATQSQVYECNAQSRTSHRAHEMNVRESRWEVAQGFCVTDGPHLTTASTGLSPVRCRLKLMRGPLESTCMPITTVWFQI